MDQNTLLIYGLIWIVCAVGSYLIAASKGADNPGTYGVLGFLFGPFGLLIAAVGAKPSAKPAEGRPVTHVSVDGQAAVGSLCGRCSKPLSPVWHGKCSHCGARYAEFPPISAARPTYG